MSLLVGRFEFNQYYKEGVELVAGKPLETSTLRRIFKDNTNCLDNKLDGCIVVVDTVLAADNDDNGTGNKARLLDLKRARSRCRKLGLVEGLLILANTKIAS